ncbi:MAG: hypothetical protein AABZ16_14255, partial [candidate division NC10 bacterium]
TFTQVGTSLFTTITTDRQGVAWNYRGSAMLPESTVALRRETVETASPDLVIDAADISFGAYTWNRPTVPASVSSRGPA